MCPWVGSHAPPVGSSFRSCSAVWSISQHRGYCSGESTVRSPHPCGWSCGAALLGRRPPPELCAGTPVISCFHGSWRRFPWWPMQPARARTSGLGVPLLPLARLVDWVAPVRPNLGCRPRCPVPMLPLVHVRVRVRGPRGPCSPVCALCAVCVCCWRLCPSSSPPVMFFLFPVFVLFCLAFLLFFLVFFEIENGARAHCRHRHG